MRREKLHLANSPSPIYKLERLSEKYGKNLYIKRDDFTGMEVSGNKIRKLEYLLKEAQDLEATDIISTGAIQSNHTRATTAAATALGFETHLVLKGEPEEFEQNLFIETAFGAKIRIVPMEADANQEMEALAKSLEAEGRKPYIIPMGGSNLLGALGYMDSFQEILDYEKKEGLSFSSVTMAIGSSGSYTGAYLKNALEKSGKKILGISVNYDKDFFVDLVSQFVQEYDEKISTDHIYINDKFIGKGYAQYTEEEIVELLEIARLTGILFDPCYTGKAFRGFLYEIEQGILQEGDQHLFIHTGGIFGWTAKMRALVDKQKD